MEHLLQTSHDLNIKVVLTDNGKEFTTHWKSKKHRFEKNLVNKNIQHRCTRVRHPWTNGFAERLNRTILEEFYR
jgi:transposase InsO family protein